MDRIAFYGSIDTGDSEGISRLIRDWVGTEKLDLKVGHVGVEIVYETDDFYLYCHEAGTDPGRAPFYLLEGHMDATREAANARLQELLRLCEARSIAGSFEYVQVNEDGDEVSELVTVK